MTHPIPPSVSRAERAVVRAAMRWFVSYGVQGMKAEYRMACACNVLSRARLAAKRGKGRKK